MAMPTEHTKHQFPHKWMTRQSYVHQEGEQPAKRAGGKLGRQAVLLLIVQGLFVAANALSGTFVNVYLWKVTSDLALIGWFALSHQLFNAATFWFAGKWVKEHNKMNSLRLGVAVSAVFYLIVLLLEKRAADYVLLLGALQGTAAGFFWLAFNVVYFEITGPNNRDIFNGWAGLLGSGAGMVAPWISGFLITNLSDTNGYRLIFAISLAVFVIGVITSFFLKKRKVPGQYEWFHAIAKLKEKGNPWRKVVPALAAQGIREGVFAFIIGLLVYIATKEEMQVGNYSLITQGVALVSFWLGGKFLKPEYRNVSMFVGAAALIAVILPFFWELNYTTLLIFGLGTSLVFPLVAIPMTSSVFDLIGHNSDSAEHRVEFVVLRELGLNLGRMLGTLLFILVVQQSAAPPVMSGLLLAIGSSPLLAWVFMRQLLSSQQRNKP
jgi:YQGE family putative transporter